MQTKAIHGTFSRVFSSLDWIYLISYLPMMNFSAFAISPWCIWYLNFPGLWLETSEFFVFSHQDCTASSTDRCCLQTEEHWPAVPFIWSLQGVLPRTLRWQRPKSSLWSKTTLLKYRKVVFLPCTHKMTIISIPLQASVKTGIPAREMPVWYLFLKSGCLSPFQTCMNTSVQD